ncbi:MAG TPA: TRAP transporter large permease subunit [Verrucomicrobiae bacterium]|nr:TRAP transporter large permease subunit [Verrucomicrobiae bacterium]
MDAEFGIAGRAGAGVPGFVRVLHRAEDVLLSLALGAMVILPLAEALLRRFWQTGIPGASALTQHLVLAVAMLGGAVAAREDRLLSLSTLTAFLDARWRSVAQILSGACGAAACVFLAQGSIDYLRIETGSKIALGIPLPLVLGLMPLGFGLIAIRVLYRSPGGWAGRAVAALLAAAMVGGAVFCPVSPEKMVWPCSVMLVLATLLGMPLFAVLGGAALILFWGKGEPIAAISVSHYDMVVNPSLPAVPLFTLAGYFLAEGGASTRLVRVFRALVGQFRGGSAIAAVLVCAFFTSFTGASGVTILALGGLLMPVLLADKFSERSSLGLLTSAGSVGLLFPPCLPLILYAIVANTICARDGVTLSIQEMFLGGVVPGLLLVGMTIVWGVLQQPRGAAAAAPRFEPREAMAAVRGALWELLLPVIALAAMFSGLATPVEAAALTALYAFVAEAFIYRDLKVGRDAPRVMAECGLLVGGVLLILGVAMGLTNYLVDAQVPDRIVDWAKGSIHSPLIFLLGLNLFLIVVGCLMDIYSAIIVVVPLIVRVGLAFGIDPVHLGIVFMANMQLGYLTPPIGMNLFMASYRFGKPMPEVIRSVIPMMIVYVIGVLLITYIPELTTALPRLMVK